MKINSGQVLGIQPFKGNTNFGLLAAVQHNEIGCGEVGIGGAELLVIFHIGNRAHPIVYFKPI